MSLRIHQEHAGCRVEFLQIFSDSYLFRTLRSSVLGGHGGFVARPGLQPLYMRVHGASWRLVFGKRLKIIPGQLESAGNAGVNVVTLLKVDVLKEIAAHGTGRNRVAIHIDPVQMRDRSLHWHQSLAEILVNAGFYVPRRHRSFPDLLGSGVLTEAAKNNYAADAKARDRS